MLAGIALAGLGVFRVTATVWHSFHSSGNFSDLELNFVFPGYWLGVALAGVVLCALALFLVKRNP